MPGAHKDTLQILLTKTNIGHMTNIANIANKNKHWTHDEKSKHCQQKQTLDT